MNLYNCIKNVWLYCHGPSYPRVCMHQYGIHTFRTLLYSFYRNGTKINSLMSNYDWNIVYVQKSSVTLLTTSITSTHNFKTNLITSTHNFKTKCSLLMITQHWIFSTTSYSTCHYDPLHLITIFSKNQIQLFPGTINDGITKQLNFSPLNSF